MEKTREIAGRIVGEYAKYHDNLMENMKYTVNFEGHRFYAPDPGVLADKLANHLEQD